MASKSKVANKKNQPLQADWTLLDHDSVPSSESLLKVTVVLPEGQRSLEVDGHSAIACDLLLAQVGMTSQPFQAARARIAQAADIHSINIQIVCYLDEVGLVVAMCLPPTCSAEFRAIAELESIATKRSWLSVINYYQSARWQAVAANGCADAAETGTPDGSSAQLHAGELAEPLDTSSRLLFEALARRQPKHGALAMTIAASGSDSEAVAVVIEPMAPRPKTVRFGSPRKAACHVLRPGPSNSYRVKQVAARAAETATFATTGPLPMKLAFLCGAPPVQLLVRDRISEGGGAFDRQSKRGLEVVDLVGLTPKWAGYSGIVDELERFVADLRRMIAEEEMQAGRDQMTLLP